MSAALSPAPDTLLEAALRYINAGFELFPVSPTTKAPLVDNGFRDATNDEAQIRRWWGSQHPDALIGCRIPVDVVVLDIDPRHGGDQTWKAIEDAYGKVAETREHHSGRGDGGRHIWFKRPDGKISPKPLSEWARRQGVGQAVGARSWSSGIDILHHDLRYTILPPSPHPDTHKPYTWLYKHDPVEMPGYVVDLITAAPVAPTPKAPTLRIADADSIADWFSSTASWNDILGPSGAGWEIVSGDGDSDGSKWRHPAATAASSCSIKHGCLFVYTPNTEFEETAPGDTHGYTRFNAWKIIEFGGDGSAAARAAREMKDGPGIVYPEAYTYTPGEPWPDIIPLNAEAAPVPFPAHVLPDWMRSHATSEANTIQAPHDLTCILGLGAISVATIGKLKVRYSWENWTQPCNLYTVVAVAPSVGKSPAKNAMFRPLDEWEQQRMDEARKARRAHQDKVDVVANKIAAHKKAMIKDDSFVAAGLLDDYNSELYDLEQQMPPNGRLMADDATIEALGMVLADSGGSIGVVSAEGGLFDRLAGLYNENGVNLDLYLEGWSGGKYTVDRVKRESINIPSANVAVITTIQPHTLDDIGARKVFAARGLVARFLMSMPVCNVGDRDRKRKHHTDSVAAGRYSNHLQSIATYHDNDTVVLELSDEACEVFSDWDQMMEYRLRDGADLHHLPEWVGKLRSNVLRLSAILHTAHMDNGQISAERVTQAIEIGDYFVSHAQMIAERWGADQTVALADLILKWAVRKELDEFSVRDVHTNNRRAFSSSEDVIPCLKLLTESGYLRPLQDGPITVGKGGKPSPRFAVNPAVRAVRAVSAGGGEEGSVSSETKTDFEPTYLSVSEEISPPPPALTGHTARTGPGDPQVEVDGSQPLTVTAEAVEAFKNSPTGW